MDWLSALQQLRHDNLPGVLITVTQVRGHAPRDAGTKMVVGTDRTWGSIGGGNLEETAIDQARELITTMIETGVSKPVTWQSRLSEHAKNDHGRQCCGGVVDLLLEPLAPRPTVAIFGVGHVGFELARIMSRLEIRLHLIDSRTKQLDQLRLADITSGTAEVTVHRALLGELVLDQLPVGAHVLIMTHDHAEDYALCDAALRRQQRADRALGSVGLIGSAAKWSRFRHNLTGAGHDATALTGIDCPIGLSTLAGKEPVVIAVGVAAALIERLQQQHPLRPDARALSLSKGDTPDRTALNNEPAGGHR